MHWKQIVKNGAPKIHAGIDCIHAYIVYIYMCIYEYIYIYIYMYEYMYTYKFIYIYIYMTKRAVLGK